MSPFPNCIAAVNVTVNVESSLSRQPFIEMDTFKAADSCAVSPPTDRGALALLLAPLIALLGRHRRRVLPALALLALLAPPARAANVPIGDCNGDGCVRVNELVIGIEIMQQTLPPEVCPAISHCKSAPFIQIDCLIAAINNALRFCPTTAGE